MHKAIFLDRDGVLNEAIVRDNKPYPPANLAELQIPADVLPTLNTLKSLGFLLIGATNQPDVARGTTLKETVLAINEVLLNTLPLDDLLVCFHDDKDQCLCRKPSPGLLTTAAKKYHIDLTQSYMIGDRAKDILAGKNAGTKTIWLNQHYQEAPPALPPDFITTSLSQVINFISQRNMHHDHTI